MQEILPILNKLLALGAVLAGAFGALVIILAASGRKFVVLDFISKHVLKIAFLAALLPSLVSLFYSDIIGYEPCPLCWYQRVFMYPLVFLFALAAWREDRRIIDYGIVLAALGFLIAAYHNIIYYFNVSVLPCPAGVSCVQRFVSEFGGFASIPMMSLIAFFFLLSILISAKMRRHD